MELTKEQLDELRLGALTAIDGLWFLELEKRFGFETALEADLEVWKHYGIILLKRLSRVKGIDFHSGNKSMDLVHFFLSTMCRVDGTECACDIRDDDTLDFTVLRCPWWENLKKAGREGKVPCETIDDIIFGHALRHVDPSLSMEITRSLPRGHENCSFRIRRS